MIYLIGIKKSVHPCGNTGTLITHYKAEYKIKEAANRFAAMYGLDEVYGLQVYPQKMCEMNNSEFVDHLRRTGRRYV